MSELSELSIILASFKKSRTWLIKRENKAIASDNAYHQACIAAEIQFLDETIQLLNSWLNDLQAHHLGIPTLTDSTKILPRARSAFEVEKERLRNLRRLLVKLDRYEQ